MLPQTFPTHHIIPSCQDYPLLYPAELYSLNFLNNILSVINNSLNDYSRVFAFRLDLRLPGHLRHQPHSNNSLINRFLESFREKIRHNRAMAKKKNPYAHDTKLRHAWARERGRDGHPHFHLIILLNYDAFRALGRFDLSANNIYTRVNEAWASALQLPLSEITGLVEFPDNAAYFVLRDNILSQQEFFRRASYLCKLATKDIGGSHHTFGCSRN